MKKIELVIVLDPRIQVGKTIEVEDKESRTQRLPVEIFPGRTEVFEKIGSSGMPSFFVNLDEIEIIYDTLMDSGWTLLVV